jgi:hypothetical protein
MKMQKRGKVTNKMSKKGDKAIMKNIKDACAPVLALLNNIACATTWPSSNLCLTNPLIRSITTLPGDEDQEMDAKECGLGVKAGANDVLR